MKAPLSPHNSKPIRVMTTMTFSRNLAPKMATKYSSSIPTMHMWKYENLCIFNYRIRVIHTLILFWIDLDVVNTERFSLFVSHFSYLRKFMRTDTGLLWSDLSGVRFSKGKAEVTNEEGLWDTKITDGKKEYWGRKWFDINLVVDKSIATSPNSKKKIIIYQTYIKFGIILNKYQSSHQ